MTLSIEEMVFISVAVAASFGSYLYRRFSGPPFLLQRRWLVRCSSSWGTDKTEVHWNENAEAERSSEPPEVQSLLPLKGTEELTIGSFPPTMPS